MACLFVAWSAQAADFFRIHYYDPHRPLTASELERLERLYGTEVLLIQTNSVAPKRPARIDGTVLHPGSADGRQWYLGTRNPALEPGWRLDRLEDKWLENLFLSRHAPTLAPKTRKVSDFILSNKERSLNALRDRIRAHMGDFVLKDRLGFQSEGRLPSSDDDWDDLLAKYRAHTRERVVALKDSDQFEAAILNLPYIAGRFLEGLLDDPSGSIVQKRLQIEQEVRLHVMEGKILPGATFLRFYGPDDYLSEADMAIYESIVQQQLLSRLPSGFEKFSCCMDIVKTPEGYFIVDLNQGLASGYFYPEEDLLTTHRVAQYYSGRSTWLLDLVGELERSDLLGRRFLLRQLVLKTRDLLTQDASYRLWDEIARYYLRDLRASRQAVVAAEIVEQWQFAGVTNPLAYYRLISEIQTVVPVPYFLLARWAQWLNAIDDEYVSRVTRGTLVIEPSCAQLLGHAI